MVCSIRYSKTSLKNDIAILRLSGFINFQQTGTRPACLPNRYASLNELTTLRFEPTIIGWGSTGTNLPTVSALRQTTVPLVDTRTCNTAYDAVQRITIGNTQACAGLGEKDTCSGDSGGPMMSSEIGGVWSVIGITSFGVKCADDRFPGVYTRVDKYLNWIDQNT